MNERMQVGLHLPRPCSESPPTPLFQVALETLLLRGPQKLRTHPLANYRYTGEGSVTAGVVWAWLGLLRSSQFPRQSLHVPRGVLSGFLTCLPRRACPLSGGLHGRCSLAGSYLLSTHSLLGSAWPGRGCQGGLGAGTPALESACSWASHLTSGCLSCGICQVGMVIAPTC